MDEQNGLVADLCTIQVVYSIDTAKAKEMNKSLQLSVHMQTISSNLVRVSGVEDTSNDVDETASFRLSFGVENKNHLLDFDELSEHYEEESDFNPWRDSVIEDEVLSEGKVFSPHRSLRNSIDLPCYEENDTESCESREDQPRVRQASKRWISADVLSRKVAAMVDAIRNKTTYNVTNGIHEAVV